MKMMMKKAVTLGAALGLLSVSGLAQGPDLVDAGLSVTGSGAHTYRVVPNWMEWPGGDPIGNTHGQIAIDSEGRIYITTDTEDSIKVFHPSGKYLKSIAADVPKVHDLSAIKEEDGEFLYATSLGRAQAVKMTLGGEIVWALDYPEASGIYTNSSEYKPTGIAVAPNGHIYVADGYGKNYIHHYDAELNYVASYGGRGKGLGEFTTCHNIAVDTRGEEPLLMVSDRDNSRMQYMKMDGEPVSIWGEFLRRPCAVSFHGDFVAVSEIQGRVTILNKLNQPVSFLGDNPDTTQWAKNGVPPHMWRDGVFIAPHGCRFDSKGNLYVMDWNASGRISKLERIEP